jgi:restriction system protein
MAIPDFQTLMLPLLQFLAKGQMRTTEAVEALSDQFNLSEEERSVLLPSGRQATMANRVHWAISYLGKAGLIQRVQRGSYIISDTGRKLLKDPPGRIDIKFLTQFPEFQEFRSASKPEKSSPHDLPAITDAEGTPEEKIDEAAEELDNALRAEVLEKARSLSPAAFEKLIVSLMLAMGYGTGGSGTHVGKSGDGGVDGTITEDALGLDVVYIQAKRYAEENIIGVEKIREFAGTLDEKGATKGVFVTTSRFALGAQTFSSKSTKRIILIDGRQLSTLMIRYGVGTRTFRKIEIRKIDADYFDDLEI